MRSFSDTDTEITRSFGSDVAAVRARHRVVFFGVKCVAKGVVGGTATAFLTYPLFVGVGFALHNVLELAIGERNWREILRRPNSQTDFDQHLPTLLAVTAAPLLSLGVGFKTVVYLTGAGVGAGSAVLALQFGGGFTGICGAAWIGYRTFKAAK
jgi:hypothetical protein